MRILTPRTLLGHQYQIVRLIGSGGMSAVYEAIDTRDGHHVAIKHNGLPQIRGAFAREAQVLTGLCHPALPQIERYLTVDDEQLLVMQFIPGDDLEQRMAAGHAGLPINYVLTWADQLLDALIYLHSRRPQIIHRDIKPCNLKLSEQGSVVLLDIGIARDRRKYTPGISHPYAAPEELQGRVGAASDLYSLGATLYHLLAGLPPIDAHTRAELLAARQPDPLRPLHELVPQLLISVSSTVHAALALAPDARPGSAQLLQQMLRQAQYGTMPQLSVASVPVQRRWWSRLQS